MMDIANDTIYLLDSDASAGAAQTPTDDDTAGSSSFSRSAGANYNSSGSSDNLDKDSRDGTPSTPNKKFLNTRSLSGPAVPPLGGSLLPDGGKGSSKKCKWRTVHVIGNK